MEYVYLVLQPITEQICIMCWTINVGSAIQGWPIVTDAVMLLYVFNVYLDITWLMKNVCCVGQWCEIVLFVLIISIVWHAKLEPFSMEVYADYVKAHWPTVWLARVIAQQLFVWVVRSRAIWLLATALHVCLLSHIAKSVVVPVNAQPALLAIS